MPVNVTRSSMPDFDEYCAEIKDLWDTRWITNMGIKHDTFQAMLKEYLNCPNVTLFTNGHLALESIIAAMDLPKGSEVITSPFTFVSTTHAIVRNGLIPVFCDINEKDYTIDVSKIESLITERTSAIVPIHVYGNMCDTEEIKRIADKYSLKVVYDAAHAFGVTYKGKSSAAFGDASMFSFHATKVFHTIEGGAVCFADDKYIEILNDMKNFGIHGPESCKYIGGNAKMNEFQAAMGICNLRHIGEEIAKRKKAVERYREHLSGIDGITLCSEQKNVASNYAYFPVVFDGFKKARDEVFAQLMENDIFSRKYFFPLTNSCECYSDFPTAGKEKTPVAAYYADRVLTLPLYSDLADDVIDKICSIVLA